MMIEQDNSTILHVPAEKSCTKSLYALRLMLCLLAVCFLPLLAKAQNTPAEAVFRKAANFYIADQKKEALQALEKGLRQYPDNAKLQALHQKLNQQQQQQQSQSQDQQQQRQQQQQQQSQQQEQADGGSQSEQEQDQEGGRKDQPSDQRKQNQTTEQQRESADSEGTEQEVQRNDPQGELQRRLQEMNISPEKAKMILEAMKSKEIQYLQQKQRQGSQRQRSDKPDW